MEIFLFRDLNFIDSYFTIMLTPRVHKLWFPAACIAYFSNCQEIEANHSRLVKKLRFSVILGVFLEENLIFLTAIDLSLLVRLFSEKYIINASFIDVGNITTANIWG